MDQPVRASAQDQLVEDFTDLGPELAGFRHPAGLPLAPGETPGAVRCAPEIVAEAPARHVPGPGGLVHVDRSDRRRSKQQDLARGMVRQGRGFRAHFTDPPGDVFEASPPHQVGDRGEPRSRYCSSRSRRTAAGVAFHFDQPAARAANAVLLAVPPRLGEPWSADTMIGVLRDALEIGKIRAVDGAALEGLGQYLPAIMLAANEGGETVSTDISRAVLPILIWPQLLDVVTEVSP
ncbi:hypothetical protein G5B40_06585 [Pikeienuella piscinae]|uniref:Uncharacterized protein n=1 Tax=Pikeienuella piscinae TaxID=2748098 RepID=A0A7L5BTX8_9RHOB|nr:hypothetical protein [Pikeienuella piscinae]QIE55145.1 hypothetical protein G5B40_06585 [Pikeienuella piscinae]